MTTRIPILIIGMVAGAGVLVGAQHFRAPALSRAADVEPSSASAASAAPAVASAPRLDPGVLALNARLERIEQKLDAAPAAPPPAAPGADLESMLARPVEPADRDDGQQKAFDQADSIIEAALRQGVWSDADQRGLVEAKAELLPIDRMKLKMKLSVAANEGKLRDMAAMPFFF
jgi:hypothetical protein